MAINRDKILQEAQKLVDKKRYDKAIAEYQKVVADDPTDVRTLLKIGNLYLQLEQFADAISTYERVGSHYSQQGFAVKAVAVYKQIREIIQKHAPHLEDRFGHIVPKLAELLTQLDLRSDALAYYDEMASRLQRIGRDRDAIDVFRKIIGLDPQNPVSHLRLADALTRVRDFDGAVTEYTEAAQILVRIGRQDDALRVIERLLQHRPEGRYARMAAEMYLDRGQPPDTMAALTKLNLAVKENPRDLDTLWLLGRAFDQLGQPQKAVEVHKEAARIAREGQNREALDRLLTLLMQRAPNDEGVRQLVATANDPLPTSMAPQTMSPGGRAPSEAPARPRDEVSEIEVIDDDLELIDDEEEEAPIPLRASYPPDDDDPANQVRQLLAAIEGARRAGEYHVAIRTLREAIAQMPAIAELRERLCDVLIESGEQEAAILEMLEFARYLVDAEGADAAARLLDEVLLLDPGNRAALELLNALGYAVPMPEEASEPEMLLEPEIEEEPQPVAVRPNAGGPVEAPPSTVTYSRAGLGNFPASYDSSGPLPGYDLDDLGESAATETGRPPAQPVHAAPAAPAPTAGMPRRSSTVELDDPFGAEPTAFGAPLPAYEIDEPEPTGRISLTGGLDESALDEIEFFQQNGMFDEAETMLAEQLSRLPNHPLLLERKRELDAARAAAAEPAASAPREASMDRAYDIAHALDSLDDLVEVSDVQQPTHQISVDAIFEQFKAGVAAQIHESDAATHYDLGVAYKEMGLVTDSIAEFELASRDPTRECVCRSMIGMIHMEQGNIEQAIDAFLLGLAAGQKTPEQEVQLTYEIGTAYEFRNNPEQALYYFQLVARIDPSYRDPRGSVAERITNLERILGGAAPKAQPKQVAVGAPDEFDAAFDDLFNPKG